MRQTVGLALPLAFAVVFGGGFAAAQDEDKKQQNMQRAAEELAKELLPKIVAASSPNQKLKIAIFPFGDTNGKIGNDAPIMGLAPQVMQGALFDSVRAGLGQAAPGLFAPISPSALPLVFDIAPIGVRPDNLDIARDVLDDANVPIGIVGKFEIDGNASVINADAPITITAIAILPNGQTATAESKLLPGDFITIGCPPSDEPTVDPSGRFNVQIFVKAADNLPDSAANAFVEKKLQISEDPDSKFHNVYFLVLKQEDKGKRFKIRLTNRGTPQESDLNGAEPSLDKDRLYAAAVLLDGVSAFFEKDTDGTFVPVVRHPNDIKKRVLTGPGRRLVPSPAGTGEPALPDQQSAFRIENGKLIDVQGPGGSVTELLGFQKDDEFADSFVFSAGDASVAEEAGITNDVGMIAVHFYPEEFPGEEIFDGENITTGPGVPSPVFPVVIQKRKNPTEVWRIYYRFEGDDLIPDNLSPVSP